MLTTKPIDDSKLTFRYSGASEHYEYDRATEKRASEQTRDPDTGMPVWKVRCVAVHQKASEHGEITVTVPNSIPPAAEFDSPISFTNLMVKDWAINGNQGQTWQADSFLATEPTYASTTSSTKSKKETASAA